MGYLRDQYSNHHYSLFTSTIWIVGVKRKLSKFADDTKLGGEVDSRGGGEQIQESIDTCIDWAKDWQI